MRTRCCRTTLADFRRNQSAGAHLELAGDARYTGLDEPESPAWCRCCATSPCAGAGMRGRPLAILSLPADRGTTRASRARSRTF